MTGRGSQFEAGDRHFLVRSQLAGSRVRLLILLVLVAAMGALVYAGLTFAGGWRAHRGEAKYIWVQMLADRGGESGGRLVRAIVTDGDRCPVIALSAGDVAMKRRAPRVASAYPILLCEAELDDAGDARVGPRRLPLRPAEANDIVLIGDTGCRLVHYDRPQRCHSGVDWPLGAVAVSAASATTTPGARPIIIHVGDFHYREKPCADADPGCSGSPFGDNWATWEEEFFKPATPLLLAAPWIILRGNHENCERAGAGWLFFFALPNQTWDGVCQDDRPPYGVAIGRGPDGARRALIVFDTANEADRYKIADHCTTYEKWLDDIDTENTEIWLALHQPLWFRGTEEESGASASPTPPVQRCEKGTTKNAVDALRLRLSTGKPNIKLILSGDVHMFEVFTPDDAKVPVQIVAGNGGTRLDPLKKPDPDKPAPIDHVSEPINSFGVTGAITAFSRYGFVVLRRGDAEWTASMRDKVGRQVV
ncbi:MAG: metallophosphoesterase, partial [Xanthobacteraceae bacterium]